MIWADVILSQVSLRENDLGAIAQLGERLHGMQEAASSILAGSTRLRSKIFIWELRLALLNFKRSPAKSKAKAFGHRRAGVAELVYALVSKTSAFTGLRVRFPPPAPGFVPKFSFGNFAWLFRKRSLSPAKPKPKLNAKAI